PDVLLLDAQAHEDVQAGKRRGARARADELDLRDILAHDAQAVEHRGADDDRRAVLVIMEDRYLHALAAFTLDVEAFGRLDVLEVDATEGRLERADDLDQFFRIAL